MFYAKDMFVLLFILHETTYITYMNRIDTNVYVRAERVWRSRNTTLNSIQFHNHFKVQKDLWKVSSMHVSTEADATFQDRAM